MLLPHYNLFINGVIQTDNTNSYSCGIFKCLIHTWITFIREQNSILSTVILTIHRTLHVVYWSQQQISFLGLKLFKPVLYFSISCILLLPLLSLLQSET